MRRQHEPVAHLEIFRKRKADGLRETAFDLSLDLLRIDRAADVVHADDSLDTHEPGRDVHFYFDRLRRITVADVRRSGTGARIERCRAGRFVAYGCRQRTAGAVAVQCGVRRVFDRAPGDPCQTRRRGGSGVRRFGAIGRKQLDVRERERKRLGHDLAQHQVRTLADVGGAAANARAEEPAAYDEFDGCSRTFGIAE